MPTFEYHFPAIRGSRPDASTLFSMCPLRLIPRIFLWDEEELKPDLRAQRILNRARIPEMARYIVANAKSYTFSAITASIDGDVIFDAARQGEWRREYRTATIPMNARFVINDGHIAVPAIEEALHENPELGDETIAVVFLSTRGSRVVSRCSPISTATRFEPRLRSVYYTTIGMKELCSPRRGSTCRGFKDLTEFERSSISNRSFKLFTLSGIYNATLVAPLWARRDRRRRKAGAAAEFWTEVATQIPDWQLAKERKVSSADLRRDFIHAHTLALAALGRFGNALLLERPKEWKRLVAKLRNLSWSRSDGKQWEGRR